MIYNNIRCNTFWVLIFIWHHVWMSGLILHYVSQCLLLRHRVQLCSLVKYFPVSNTAKFRVIWFVVYWTVVCHVLLFSVGSRGVDIFLFILAMKFTNQWLLFIQDKSPVERLKAILSVLRICDCFAQVTIPMKDKHRKTLQQHSVQIHNQGNRLDGKVQVIIRNGQRQIIGTGHA